MTGALAFELFYVRIVLKMNKNKIIIISSLMTLLLVAVVIALNSSADKKTTETVNLNNINKFDLSLGSRNVPVTLVEFGDLRCSSCREFALTTMPEIINKQVKNNKVNVEFRNWAILGNDSLIAAQASLAASLQGRYWPFIEEFYRNGPSDGQELNQDILNNIARSAGIMNMKRWATDTLNTRRWKPQLMATNNIASKQLFFEGTPSFAFKLKGMKKLIPTKLSHSSSYNDFNQAIKEAYMFLSNQKGKINSKQDK